MRKVKAMMPALLLPVLLAGCGAADAEAAACDRACIVGVTDSYLAALASHDPSAAPFADNVAFVENLERLEPGEGLWRTVTQGKGGFAIYVPDPELQQSGWIGLMERDGKPVLLALRLKLKGARITEVEHLIAEPAAQNLGNLVQPRRGLLAAIDEEQRLPHDDLVRISASYYNAVDDNDASLTPFAADCQRTDNGLITAGSGWRPRPSIRPEHGLVAGDCAGQINGQAFVYIDRIENRRIVAADPVTGLVFGLSHFRHPMDNLPYKVTLADGSIAERNRQNMPSEPYDLPAAHIFKIGPDRQLHEIEAVGVVAPHNSPTGWD